MCKSSVSIFRLSSSNRRNTGLKTLTPQIPSTQPLQKEISSDTAQDIQVRSSKILDQEIQKNA